MSSIYKHDELSTTTSIRLFCLAPGEGTDPLQGTILMTDLESHPPYEAISYVWGPEDPNSTLPIGTGAGVPHLTITPNLVDGLKRFRHPTDSRMLWIDSVCIDQSSSEEKNHQVPLMGAIYRQATLVLIWLGEDLEPGRSAILLQSMWQLHDALDALEEMHLELSNGMLPHWYKDLGLQGPDANAIHESVGIPLLDSIEFEAVQDLIRNPWFSRAWTWQESFVAEEIAFHRGDQSWSKDPLFQANLSTRKLRDITGLGDRYVIEARLVMDMLGKDISPDQSLNDFHSVLTRRRGSGCKNTSDLIFSLLAARNCPTIQVDYNHSWETVFAQCTFQLILTLESLTPLSDVEKQRRPTALPSWAPDWRVRTWTRNDLLSMSTDCSYAATGSSLPKVSLSADSLVLRVTGVLFDRIVHLEDGEWMDLERRIAAKFGNYDDIEQPYPYTGQSIKEACSRTWYRDTMAWKPGGRDERWPDEIWDEYESIWTDSRKNEQTKLAHGRMIQVLSMARLARSAFVTEDQRIGMADNSTRAGDVIALLWGGDMPFILRPLAEENHYTLVADCYVHGFMDGEALQELMGKYQISQDAEDEFELDISLFPTQEFHIH